MTLAQEAQIKLKNYKGLNDDCPSLMQVVFMETIWIVTRHKLWMHSQIKLENKSYML